MTVFTAKKDGTDPKTKDTTSIAVWSKRAAASAALAMLAVSFTPGVSQAQQRLQTGSLVCKGEGGWGAIITSKKTFDCAFTTPQGRIKGKYKGTIQKYGIDIGKTGNTALTWLVFGPVEISGENYEAGSLAGDYAGIGGEITLGGGVGANALLGGSEDSFALQPISVQVQTGFNIAAAVQTLTLEYVGPLE